MPPDCEVTPQWARSAPADDLDRLVQHQDEKILLVLPQNPNFTEQHAERLLNRAGISSAVIAGVAEADSCKGRENVRLKLAQHPHSPRRVALAALRQMFLLNLVRLSQNPAVPSDIRRAAEEIILARIPHLAIGEKIMLARRAPARIAAAILAEGHPQASKLAMANPFLTESQILRILAKDALPERVVEAVARHGKWSVQYHVRIALLRNSHTPLESIQKFVSDFTLQDLQGFVTLQELSESVRSAIAREIERRKLQSHTVTGGTSAGGG